MALTQGSHILSSNNNELKVTAGAVYVISLDHTSFEATPGYLQVEYKVHKDAGWRLLTDSKTADTYKMLTLTAPSAYLRVVARVTAGDVEPAEGQMPTAYLSFFAEQTESR